MLNSRFSQMLAAVLLALALLAAAAGKSQAATTTPKPLQEAQTEEATDLADEEGKLPVQAKGHTQRELSFMNGEVHLAGSLVLPEGEAPFPAVVMIHGSEPDKRDLFWRTGDAMAFLNAGIAVYIYDRRGMGESQGDWRSATLDDLAGDALAAVRLVKAQPEINPEQVGTFGVSQGGRLAMQTAAQSQEVNFVVNVTGASLPFAQQEMWTTGNELRQRGFSERAIKTTMKLMHMLFSARPLLKSGVLPLGELYIWFVPLDPYRDPADDLVQITQPVFVAYGAQDMVVPTRESVAVVQAAFEQKDSPLNQLVIYPRAGHGARLQNGSWVKGHIERMTGWVHSIVKGEVPQAATLVQAEVDPGENRWYGLGPAATPWYATYSVQLGLALFFLVVFLLGLVTSLNPRAGLALPGLGSLPRIVLLLISLAGLLLLVGWGMVMGYLAFADPNGSGPQIPYAGALSLLSLAAVLLTAGIAGVALRARRTQDWTKRMKRVYILVALAGVGLLGFLAYWNLLGLPL